MRAEEAAREELARELSRRVRGEALLRADPRPHTSEITDVPAEELTDHEGREKLKRPIFEAIHRKTDAHVDEVLHSDLTVQ